MKKKKKEKSHATNNFVIGQFQRYRRFEGEKKERIEIVWIAYLFIFSFSLIIYSFEILLFFTY